MRKLICATTFLLFSIFSTSAGIKLPALVGDNLVLQQNCLVNIWGWAEPGSIISIKASWGATAKTQTGDDGKWIAKIMKPRAS